MITLWAIVGPTGSGKSALALALAERAGGEIVSVDSAQIYRGLDIGTAKPTVEERARVPHHLIDVLGPNEQWSAAAFAKAADLAIAGVVERGRTPILCGGTGLWFRALTRGVFEAPDIDPEVRAAVREALVTRGAPAIHAELAAVDPDAARRLHPNDAQRIGRALEVYRQTGRPISELQAVHGFKDRRYHVAGVGLSWPREALDARLAARTHAMYAAGLIEETRALIAAGAEPHGHGLSIIGYRDAVAHLEGRLTLAEAERETYLATRRYAKRQHGWFSDEPGVAWVPAETPAEAILESLRSRSSA